MCDICAFCQKPAYEVELRFTEANELTCHDCFDADMACSGDDCDWHSLTTPDEMQAMREMADDDRAHALRDRRAGL